MLGQISDYNQLVAYFVKTQKSKLFQKLFYLRKTLNSFQCMYFISYAHKNKMKKGKGQSILTILCRLDIRGSLHHSIIHTKIANKM